MKKSRIILFVVLILVGIIGTFGSSSLAQAADTIWDSCPRGMVDCAYPGRCSSYIDTNNDGICDRSQPEPESDSTTVTSDTATTVDIAGNAADIPAVSSTDIEPESPADDSSSAAAVSSGRKSIYNFIPLLLTFTLLYATTWILSYKRIIGLHLHRKIWNFVLLVSAVISAFLGVILILNLDFDTAILLPFNMLFWHVEAGIIMAVISVFHIIWHRKYFIKIFKSAT